MNGILIFILPNTLHKWNTHTYFQNRVCHFIFRFKYVWFWSLYSSEISNIPLLVLCIPILWGPALKCLNEAIFNHPCRKEYAGRVGGWQKNFSFTVSSGCVVYYDCYTILRGHCMACVPHRGNYVLNAKTTWKIGNCFRSYLLIFLRSNKHAVESLIEAAIQDPGWSAASCGWACRSCEAQPRTLAQSWPAAQGTPQQSRQ